jgi:GTP-binding protein LepA
MYENETSAALGFGCRCGFLGVLHLEIIQERIEREFGLSIITTAPSVVYKVNTTNRAQILIDNPALLPPEGRIESIEEQMVKASIMVPAEFVGTIMEWNKEKRGSFLNMDYITESRVNLHYELPLSEIVYDYFDQLKSRTRAMRLWTMNYWL